jgi:hypothetical protein
MSQTSTNHPPVHLPDLPPGEQILLRLDEIIGLLDRMATELEGGLPLLWAGDLMETADADELDDGVFVGDWPNDEEERLH